MECAKDWKGIHPGYKSRLSGRARHPDKQSRPEPAYESDGSSSLLPIDSWYSNALGPFDT